MMQRRELRPPVTLRFRRHMVWGVGLGLLNVGIVVFLVSGGATEGLWQIVVLAAVFSPVAYMGFRFGQLRLEVLEDGLLAANLYSSRFVAWSDVEEFGFGPARAWGMIGWIERTDGSRLALDGFGSRWWMINAGFDGPARRIAELNGLLANLKQ